MSRNLPLLALPLLLLTTLAAASCGSSRSQPASTPTLSAASATATEEDIDSTISQLVLDYINIKDMPIDHKVYYTDASGTDWVRFDARVTAAICRAGPQEGPTGAVSGVMNKAQGENWELVNLGAGDIQCGIPTNVQVGLGFQVCSASEEELNNAIKEFDLAHSAPTIKDTDEKICGKAYYTDTSGTNWVMYSMLPIPGLTGSTYGIVKKVLTGNWEGVNMGSAAVECGLPEDVQVGLGFKYCPPGT
ncbi:MAG: hypothetical protein ABSG55_03945 [Dehalococcoidia bacterium]|jgi:hypothetical protein